MTNSCRKPEKFCVYYVVLCLLISIILATPEVRGEARSSASLREMKDCIRQINERTAAIRMGDWAQLDTIARRFIQTCKHVSDRQEIANAYGSVASANFEMGHFEEALSQANAGIATHYLEPTNHVEKVKALYALAKISEGKEAWKRADHVLHLAIEDTRDNLQTSKSDLETEYLRSKASLYQSELAVLDKYHNLLEKK